MSEFNKEALQNAATLLIAATGKDHSHLPYEDQLMIAAAFAVGVMEQNTEVTMALDHSTDWLQDAYEQGRNHAAG